MENIPVKEIVSAIGGVLGVFGLSKLKGVPLNITFGKAKKESAVVTVEMLESHCQREHTPVDKMIKEIHDRQTVIIETINAIKEKLNEKLSEHGKDIAVLQTEISHLRR